MEQFSRLFSIPLQIFSDFGLWHLSQLPAFLQAAYKDRHISYIFRDDQIPFFTSKRILYLQEYMQPVGDLVLPCNTFRMLDKFETRTIFGVTIQMLWYLQIWKTFEHKTEIVLRMVAEYALGENYLKSPPHTPLDKRMNFCRKYEFLY